ncbi:hypothetical protein DPMN_107861 [Dreissena polymorpha]|uniref:Uncharacterized protein n=1 Tax=Dreissena polymorpha TaxID=45954 RepID=A0A9D4K7H2_DREPO|nr:hypothetical protein DPMN_107861 [Dreissena polymorpha]
MPPKKLDEVEVERKISEILGNNARQTTTNDQHDQHVDGGHQSIPHEGPQTTKTGPRIEVLKSYYDTSKHMRFNVVLVMKHTATDEYWTLFFAAINHLFECNEGMFETNCECFVIYTPVRRRRGISA